MSNYGPPTNWAAYPQKRNEEPTEEQTEGRKAWDQLPEEPAHVYDKFLVYLQLGPDRTLQKAKDAIYGEQVGSVKTLQSYSRKYSWINRAEAWDRHVMRQRSQKIQGVVENIQDELAEKHRPVAKRLAQAAAGEIKITRDELNAIRTYMDQFNVQKSIEASQTNIYNNNVTVEAKELPDEVKNELGISGDNKNLDKDSLDAEAEKHVPSNFDEVDEADFLDISDDNSENQ